MRFAKLMVVVGGVLMVSTAAWAAARAEERLPITVAGEHLWAGGELSRKVELPTPGVWYIWLKASNPGWQPAVVTWDLDGRQPLHSARIAGIDGKYIFQANLLILQAVHHRAQPQPGFFIA